MKWGLPISPSILVWATIGLLRYLNEKRKEASKRNDDYPLPIELQQPEQAQNVAVLLPCFNEEIVVGRTIGSLKQSVPAEHIFLVSDGSTDNTARIARAAGCSVLELMPGRGKAQALEAGIAHFKLFGRFEYIIMADADAIFGPDYARNALGIFGSDHQVAAIAGYARTPWKKHIWPRADMFFISYRVRLYRIYQLLLTYGWTWKHTNVCPVVPGFASIYRSDVLRQLEIHVPGLAIEDFNLGFQIHKKKLGRIAHHPSVYAIDQDPNNLDDYLRQVERWNVGFWQTVRHNGFWPSLFWFAQGLFMLETLFFYLSLLFLPLTVVILTRLLGTGAQVEVIWGGLAFTSFEMYILSVYFGFFVLDYLMTIFVALLDRRYMLAFYGLGFTFLRVLDALLLIFTIPAAFRGQSSGRWRPPTRYQEKQTVSA